ncbi:MAG: glycoside hydrolase family 26 protein [Oscillospiraceae bacterium]|nr:glycoside hydrolase family 26 protein [Oscillospiraceae bacterium]
MLRKMSALLILILFAALFLFGCSEQTPRDVAQRFWHDGFADGVNFTSANDLVGLTTYWNRTTSVNAVPNRIGSDDDVSFMLDNGNVTRFVNMSDGYALTLPFSAAEYTADLALSGVRTKLVTADRIITITREDQNPYDNDLHGWLIYYDEWLTRYIANAGFLRTNRLIETRPAVQHDINILDGYVVSLYSILIRNHENIDMPYYNIAIIRQEGEYERFLLIVQKATHDVNDEFDAMLQTLREFEPQGESQNATTPFELTRADYWDDATAAYFDLLMQEDYLEWGFFTNVLQFSGHYNYNTVRQNIQRNQSELQEMMDTTFGIFPTYTPLGWHGTAQPFPLSMAREFAGGDGFNGRPVLQMTYQFTDTNNGNLYGYTPMFNILNGRYDDRFREFAQGMKEYGYPILFRLNNEMDGDWTSYSGILTLLDPDIFIKTWEHLYNLFREEGVTNLIWIFNPNSTSVPYSNWGKWYNYMPALHTFHMIGISPYEFGNNMHIEPFASLVDKVYERYERFSHWPWAISEFAAGSGGEARRVGDSITVTSSGRHEYEQAEWVRDMFHVLDNRHLDEYTFARPIRIAVWFNVNDYLDYDGEMYILNHLRIGAHTPLTIEAFRQGFAAE